MSGGIDRDIRDGVMVLTINRPEKKNALSDAMYRSLSDSFAEASEDDAIGAVLITGAGGDFTTGNDIADFLKVAMGEGGVGDDTGVGRFLMAQIDLTKPLVAAVEGLAVGIGATLLFHCDLVYAAENADIRTPFTDLGLTAENAASYLAPRVMGHQRSFAMLALGEPLKAQEAMAAGLVNRVVPASELFDVAFAAAKRLAAKPRGAIEATRAMLRGDPATIKAVSLEETRVFGERLKSDEARAAFTAFMSRNK